MYLIRGLVSLQAVPTPVCNRPNPPLVDIVCFGPLRIVVSFTVFKMCLLRRGFHTLIKNVSFPSLTVGFHNLLSLGPSILADTCSPLQSMWDLTIHPTHRLVSTSFHNNPNPSLVDIVRFDPLRIVVNLTILKTRLLGRGFHTLIKNVRFPLQPMWGFTIYSLRGLAYLLTLVPLSNRCGISQSTLHTARCLLPFITIQTHL